MHTSEIETIILASCCPALIENFENNNLPDRSAYEGCSEISEQVKRKWMMNAIIGRLGLHSPLSIGTAANIIKQNGCVAYYALVGLAAFLLDN